MRIFTANHPFLTACSHQFRRSILAFLLVICLAACSSPPPTATHIPVTLVIYDSTPDPTASPRPISTLLQPRRTATPRPGSSGTPPQPSGSPVSPTLAGSASTPSATPVSAAEPLETSDLLFLSGPRLLRWDHVTNFTTGLAENVVQFSPDAAGEKIAMLRRQKITANGVQLFNLDILDLKQKQIHTLVENSPPLFQVALSPDGERIAYLPQEAIGQVFVQSVSPGSEPVRVGECRPANDLHCKGLLWSPDGRSIAWNDRDGVWLSSMRDGLPALVLPNQVEITDPESQTQKINVSFGSLQWSPVGRFILAQVIPSMQGVHWYGIIDTRDGRLVSIPGSSEYARSCLGALWLPNGDLLVTHGGNSQEGSSPTARTWQVIPTRNDLLVLAETTELQAGSLPPASVTSGYEADYCLTSPYRLDGSTILTLVEAAGPDAEAQLFKLDLEEGALTMILQLPANTSQLIWSPDGFGSLVLTRDGQIYFVYTDEAQLLPLSDVLGAEVEGFHWLPPMPRD